MARRMLWLLLLSTLLALASLPVVGLAQTPCPRDGKERVNLKGSSYADVTVGATAALVADANPNRCSVTIRNTTANDMRCMSAAQGTPTATAGIPILGNEIYTMSTEGNEAWYCIRSGGSDAAAAVIEMVPVP